jgi:tellurite methyltransferase
MADVPMPGTGSEPMPDSLASRFGQIDIYLFDQLLRGRITRDMRVLDAGCGTGRNLVYLLANGFEVSAVDSDAGSVEAVRATAARLAPQLSSTNFRVEPIETMTFASASADLIISSAVMHFASGVAQFDAMLDSMWRVLAPGGMLFCRLASTIGMAGSVQPLGGRRFHLPDGSDRYLVDEDILMGHTARLGGSLMDPLKTIVVQNQRAMTTWVVRKSAWKQSNPG